MPRRPHPLLVVFALGLGACASAPPPPAPCPSSEAPEGEFDAMSNEQLARKMLEVTGAANLGKQILDTMLDSFSKMPGLPPGFLERFRAEAHPEQVVDLAVPIYAKNLDRSTMISAIRYYRSEGGQAFIAKLPVISKESAAAGQRWGRALAERIIGEMKSGR